MQHYKGFKKFVNSPSRNVSCPLVQQGIYRSLSFVPVAHRGISRLRICVWPRIGNSDLTRTGWQPIPPALKIKAASSQMFCFVGPAVTRAAGLHESVVVLSRSHIEARILQTGISKVLGFALTVAQLSACLTGRISCQVMSPGGLKRSTLRTSCTW
jgi:hypothetical protein